MIYERFRELPDLLERKLITKRPHPKLPLFIYNYSAGATFLPVAEWTEAMKDCRGLILAEDGRIVGRPFRKFWNWGQQEIPEGSDFTVWEKMDGSLGIICYFNGERVVATRGSFESDQAIWLGQYLDRNHSDFYPDERLTYLVEIIFPENRIVVDYGKRKEPVLLAVLDQSATDLWHIFDMCSRFTKARRFDSVKDFDAINSNPAFAGEEGFVVQWPNGFRAKVKLEEYKRLHRLVTQCSTRTIWEMLRTGALLDELLERVPADFADWVQHQVGSLQLSHSALIQEAADLMAKAPQGASRKEFAQYATSTPRPNFLFAMLDGKPLNDLAWKVIEPRWATPFRRDIDA